MYHLELSSVMGERLLFFFHLLMPISFILQVIIASAAYLHEGWSRIVNFKDLIHSAVWGKKDFV